MQLPDISGMFTGATIVGLLGHAVNTFPVPNNIYGKWFLGTIQWFVGQRENASNTVNTPTLPTK